MITNAPPQASPEKVCPASNAGHGTLVRTNFAPYVLHLIKELLTLLSRNNNHLLLLPELFLFLTLLPTLAIQPFFKKKTKKSITKLIYILLCATNAALLVHFISSTPNSLINVLDCIILFITLLAQIVTVVDNGGYLFSYISTVAVSCLTGGLGSILKIVIDAVLYILKITNCNKGQLITTSLLGTAALLGVNTLFRMLALIIPGVHRVAGHDAYFVSLLLNTSIFLIITYLFTVIDVIISNITKHSKVKRIRNIATISICLLVTVAGLALLLGGKYLVEEESAEGEF